MRVNANTHEMSNASLVDGPMTMTISGQISTFCQTVKRNGLLFSPEMWFGCFLRHFLIENSEMGRRNRLPVRSRLVPFDASLGRSCFGIRMQNHSVCNVRPFTAAETTDNLLFSERK